MPAARAPTAELIRRAASALADARRLCEESAAARAEARRLVARRRVPLGADPPGLGTPRAGRRPMSIRPSHGETGGH